MASPARVFILIPTHTTRHLAACLCSLAHQTKAPSGVVVTCDVDDAAIGELLREWWPRVAATLPGAPSLIHARRPHTGRAMLNQVRNNGLRALRDHSDIRDDDVVVVLDGDTMLAADAVARHAAIADEGADVIIPFRFMLEQEVTATIRPEDVLARGVHKDLLTTRPMRDTLARLDRRYRLHLLLSRFGLTKAHKPKIIGGHHAVRWRNLLDVNGFDEEYHGYGFDDDDLSRRLRRRRPPTRIAVDDILAFHLWHPIRAPSRVKDSPGYERWMRTDLPVACLHGVRNGLPQVAPTVDLIR